MTIRQWITRLTLLFANKMNNSPEYFTCVLRSCYVGIVVMPTFAYIIFAYSHELTNIVNARFCAWKIAFLYIYESTIFYPHQSSCRCRVEDNQGGWYVREPFFVWGQTREEQERWRRRCTSFAMFDRSMAGGKACVYVIGINTVSKMSTILSMSENWASKTKCSRSTS